MSSLHGQTKLGGLRSRPQSGKSVALTIFNHQLTQSRPVHVQLITIISYRWWIPFYKLTAFRISKMFTIHRGYLWTAVTGSQHWSMITVSKKPWLVTKLFILSVHITWFQVSCPYGILTQYSVTPNTPKHSFPSWGALLATSWEAHYALYFPQLSTRSIFLVQHLTTMCSTILSMCMSMHSLRCSLEVIIQNWYDVFYDVNIWLCLLVFRNPL